MGATAEPYLAGGHESVPGPNGSRFGTERLGRGFWIGEVDGDCVFIDQQTLGRVRVAGPRGRGRAVGRRRSRTSSPTGNGRGDSPNNKFGPGGVRRAEGGMRAARQLQGSLSPRPTRPNPGAVPDRNNIRAFRKRL